MQEALQLRLKALELGSVKAGKEGCKQRALVAAEATRARQAGDEELKQLLAGLADRVGRVERAASKLGKRGAVGEGEAAEERRRLEATAQELKALGEMKEEEGRRRAEWEGSVDAELGRVRSSVAAVGEAQKLGLAAVAARLETIAKKSSDYREFIELKLQHSLEPVKQQMKPWAERMERMEAATEAATSVKAEVVRVGEASAQTRMRLDQKIAEIELIENRLSEQMAETKYVFHTVTALYKNAKLKVRAFL